MSIKHYLRSVICGGLLIMGATSSMAQPQITSSPSENSPSTRNIPVQDIQRFANVIAQIKQFYIEPIQDKALFNNAIKGMLTNLDPHSSFLDTNDLRDLKTFTTGEFGGIGIEVMPENGFIKVISPLDDTPASKAGIKAGDLIVRIDNKLVKDMTIEQAINLIRGKKGTQVNISLIRKGETKPLNLTLTREVVKVQAVKSRLLENGYGYIRIAFFQQSVKPDLDKAIEKLQQESGGQLNGLILDLRNNPGGLLDSAVSVADEFLDSQKLKNNKLIVYTKGRIPGQDLQANATTGDSTNGTPMVVLINQGSASASEIVAGALQDHKRAIILGVKSFGKGSVQTVIPIDNESAIKLTTALYYTPSGRSIQAKGIQPDVVVADLKIPKSSTQDITIAPIEEADLENHLSNGNKNKEATEVNKTQQDEAQEKINKTERDLARQDFQLYEALNLLKGLHAAKL